MKENNLLVNKKIYKAKRKLTHPKPKASFPNQIWGTDMTKVMFSQRNQRQLIRDTLSGK